MKTFSILASAFFLSSSMLSADVTIKTGWQLLGATQELNTRMFDNTCVDYLWKYDTTNITNPEWQVHIANGLNYTHTYAAISSLATGEGYWVMGHGDCVISLVETPPAPPILDDTNTTASTETNTTIGLFRDDVNEVVTDNNTSLVWQDNSDAQTILKDWQGAIDYCEAMDFAGQTDWRLPSITELESIVDTANTPTIKSEFQNTISRLYWSSTTNAYNASGVWGVYFLTGYTESFGKTNNVYVRCVRGGQ